jgi:hypothetical protein
MSVKEDTWDTRDTRATRAATQPAGVFAAQSSSQLTSPHARMDDATCTYMGIGSYRPRASCPFCHCSQDSDLATLTGTEDTYFCRQCKRMCLLEPGLQSGAEEFSSCVKPDVVIPVTPITRCVVYRHKLACSDEEWYHDFDEDDDDVEDDDHDGVYESRNPNYMLVVDKTFASPVWDVTTLLRGVPPLITIGDSTILWDDKGRPRRGRWFVACKEGRVPL